MTKKLKTKGSCSTSATSISSKNIGAFTPNVLRRIDPPVTLTPAPLDELDTAALAPPLMADAFAFAGSSDPGGRVQPDRKS